MRAWGRGWIALLAALLPAIAEASYAAYRVPGPKERVVVPGITHYDVYRGETLQTVIRLALEWYDKRLK